MSQVENQNSLEELEQYERREERAYAMFLKQYQRRYPQPEKPSAVKKLPPFWWVFGLIALAGSLLASERTVSVYAEIAKLTANHTWIAYGVGIVAFIVVDGGAISFRFARIWLTYRYAPEPPAITAWVSRGAVFAFTAQLIAQLYGVREIVSWLPTQAEDALQLMIALAAALSGMVLAFVTGEILAVLSLQAQHDNHEERQRYEADIAQWREGLTTTWKAERHRIIGTPPRADKRLTRAASRLTDTASDKRADRHSVRPLKLSPKEQEALRFLVENPDKVRLSVRALEALTGINRDAFNRARRWYEMEASAPMSEPVSTHSNGNGHHTGEGEG